MTTSEHFTVHLFLYDIEPKIWRRISVPSTFTFAQFHQVIQKSMGWLNLQEHEFLHGKGKKKDQLIGASDNEHADSTFFQNEESITLAEFVGRKKLPLRLLYRYDLMEEWIHEIVIEAKDANPSATPLLLEGERACPPEDSGGAWEYKACLAGEAQWMEDDYDPEYFDPSSVKL